MSESIQEVIRRAEEILQTAWHGYEDLVGNNKGRRFTGLRNLIVFGRSVSFVIQNLRTPVGDKRFDTWYEKKQGEMKSDPIMKYFVSVRNEILKEGKLGISTAAHIHHFSSEVMRKLGTPPPGANSFFIGDQFGGSGWEIEMPDGATEKYYVELPASVAEVKQQFIDLPVPEDDELKSKSVEELSKYYLEKVELLLDDARSEFLGEPAKKLAGKRLPPYIKVIK
ncbi:hypothetical protein [Permianibacter aggregans]|uniref:Uncharacterized protein n=1 Tax=Permianibacter aggregans TaxID=1510150 RepID=A0A4R6UPZ0_9GAMM|nr:hypothetical protein [Permianibacter aggregans]QGX40552.1 hypothetical protein E2H98_13085 [Permianibacter aggregans]TDQ49298.1 hypothetical protein EV696_1042 [Permianibacter aggregans]